MSGIFGEATLGAFEDASASIVLRRLDAAFERAGIALGTIASDDGGARRVRFRRYVASVDQRDPHERDRLGDALGALVREVADSKVAFLVSAAERDGFSHVDGTFRVVATPGAFAVSRVEDLASLEDRGRRLRRLARDRPDDAVAGALSLVRSVCAVIAAACGETVGADVRLVCVVDAVVASRGVVSPTESAARALVRSLARLCSDHERCAGVSTAHARLTVDVAVAIAAFVAETCATDAALS